jgi:hypothetical protein
LILDLVLDPFGIWRSCHAQLAGAGLDTVVK